MDSIGKQSAPTCEETIDPRILRSRRLLQDALRKLLATNELSAISIAEIASEAGLNRATFYLHYTDKNALLQAMTAERFRALLEKRGIVLSCEGALRSITLGVCDYFTETTGCPEQLSKMPLESSIVPVLRTMLLRGYEEHPPPPGTPTDLIATAVAWAIYGAASQWFQMPNRAPAEDFAASVEKLVKPVFTAAS